MRSNWKGESRNRPEKDEIKNGSKQTTTKREKERRQPIEEGEKKCGFPKQKYCWEKLAMPRGKRDTHGIRREKPPRKRSHQ